MAEDKIYVTEEGYQQYLERIEKVKSELKKNSINKSSSYEGAVGDGWHDNFEFEDAKRNELRLMSELEKLYINLNKLVIIQEIKSNNDFIYLNDIILLGIYYDEKTYEEEYYKITGNITSNFKGEIVEITRNSPLGEAIYNKKVGDIVTYSVNGNVMKVIIKEKLLDSRNKV